MDVVAEEMVVMEGMAGHGGNVVVSGNGNNISRH